jgi:hypothetical protein
MGLMVDAREKEEIAMNVRKAIFFDIIIILVNNEYSNSSGCFS